MVDPTPTEAEAWAVLLSVQELGPASFGALLRQYGDGRTILEEASRPGAAARFTAIVATVETRAPKASEVGRGIVALARAIGPPLRLLRAADLTIVTLDHPLYPERLRAIELPARAVRPRPGRDDCGGADRGDRRDAATDRAWTPGRGPDLVRRR